MITKEFGPRIRIVSVITDAPIEPDPKCETELCIHCKMCLKLCPAHCFTENGPDLYQMDKNKCTKYHIDLVKQHHWPCGYCATFCPVGKDMELYRGITAVTPNGIDHCQKYGS